MKLDAVSADRRFDQTAFSNEVVDGRALPLITTYTCPRCSERVGFSKQNFEERADSQKSNLDAGLQRAFDDCALRHGEEGKPFLDWRCPGCALAVRVYAHAWAGGRHGDAGVDLTLVLEAQDADEVA